MSNPLVSVCINAYNAEKYIRETVDSVLNQTYRNLQIIVVDDCSTDNTYEILKSIDDPRLEIYRLPYNCHISNACNEGFKHVKGEYVAHLDADDLWVPEKIEKQVEFLESNSNYGACFTHAEIIDENSELADESGDYLRKIYAFENRSQANMYRFFYDNSNRLCHPSSLIRTDIIKKIGNHDVTMLYLHDFDYWMRLAACCHIFIMPERLTLVRRHSTNNSDMNELKWNAHNTEMVRLMYKSICMCPDELFLEAFSDKLHFVGNHTHEEVEIEKALLLLNGTITNYDNPVLGLYKFSQLFKEEKYINIAKERFGFSTRNLYEFQQKQAYFDSKKKAELVTALDESVRQNGELLSQNNQLSNANTELSNANKALSDANAQLNVLNNKLNDEKNSLIEENHSLSANVEALNGHVRNLDNTVNQLNTQVFNYSSQLFEIQNSFFWKITSPFRKVINKIKSYAKRHEKLLLFFIYSKGFLKGGFKGAGSRVDDYIKYKANIEKLSVSDDKNAIFYVSDELRKKHNNTTFNKKVKFSIVVPLYNTPISFLEEMIKSVQDQTYDNWELCLADGSDNEHNYVGQFCLSLSKKDRRIKYKKLKENKGIAENTNECLSLATGDYIGLFDHDDLLHPTVLFKYATVINEKNADFIYCDEMTFTDEEKEGFKCVLRHHKPDFSPDTLRSYNYICHFTCFSKELFELVGNFNSEFDGSQDYDLILRLTEKARNIIHIPELLYFWRAHKLSVASAASAKPYVVNAAERAIEAHLNRIGLNGTVRESYAPTTYKIDYEIQGNPLISIIIPNKDHIDDLGMCLDSIFTKSTYNNYEIIIVENNSTEQKTFDYYDTLQKSHNNVKVVFWKEKVFNYSAINNFGANFAKGEYVLLLNNDIEILTPNWLEEMLMFAQRKDVGAVGTMLYYPDDTIQHAGVILGIGGVAGHSHKYFERNAYGYVSRACISQNLSACTAACLLMRKDVFDEVGGLDEGFAVAFNDVDLCMKIREAGYLIVFTPYAEFYHYESKSRGFEDSPEKIARFNSEINRFFGKWKKELDAGDPYYNPNLTLEREDFSLK